MSLFDRSIALAFSQRPALHQRKSAMAPWQNDIGSHIADDARIMPIIARQFRIGGVTIGDQRRARLNVGPDESLDRFGRVVGDHRQTQSTRTGIKIFRAPSSRLGLASAPIDHLDRAGDEDFAGGAGLEKGVADAEGNFRLIHLDDAFENGSIIERRSFCVSSQAVL